MGEDNELFSVMSGVLCQKSDADLLRSIKNKLVGAKMRL